MEELGVNPFGFEDDEEEQLVEPKTPPETFINRLEDMPIEKAREAADIQPGSLGTNQWKRFKGHKGAGRLKL